MSEHLNPDQHRLEFRYEFTEGQALVSLSSILEITMTDKLTPQQAAVLKLIRRKRGASWTAAVAPTPRPVPD